MNGGQAMPDLARIHYVAEQYDHLQGLRLVPLALPFLASAAWRAGWLGGWPTGSVPMEAAYWFFGGLALAIALSFTVRTYYRRRFGMTRPLPWRSGFITLTTLFACFVWLVSLQSTYEWPVSVPAIFIA